METLSSRLKSAMKNKGYTQVELAEAVSKKFKRPMDQQYISNILTGKSLKPRRLDMIATVLTVSVEWLEYGNLSSQGELINREPLKRIPLIEWHMIGNKGLRTVNDNTEVVLVSDNNLSDQTFALEIIDDSMSPECTPGTFVVVDPLFTPVHEDLVIIDLGANKTPIMREYLVDGPNISLNAFNPRYSKFTLTNDMKILGVVHSSIKKRKK